MDSFVDSLRRHYRAIQCVEGDERLRLTFRAERSATRQDPQLIPSAKAEILKVLDDLETELLLLRGETVTAHAQ